MGNNLKTTGFGGLALLAALICIIHTIQQPNWAFTDLLGCLGLGATGGGLLAAADAKKTPK